MFIAMNRFKIKKGNEEEFENIWRKRDTFLSDVKGFKQFNLVKRTNKNDEDGFTIFASHSVWTSEEDFKQWTRSEAFKRAHQSSDKHRDIYIGHPEFEGFEIIL